MLPVSVWPVGVGTLLVAGRHAVENGKANRRDSEAAEKPVWCPRALLRCPVVLRSPVRRGPVCMLRPWWREIKARPTLTYY